MHDVLLELPGVLKALLLDCQLALQLVHDSGVLIAAEGLTHAVGVHSRATHQADSSRQREVRRGTAAGTSL